MLPDHRTRRINPRLGTYFGIYVSAFVALALLVAIAEQMSAPDALLRWSMLLGPLAFYVAIAVASHTNQPVDFFAAGRRVPAFFTGLGLGACTLGGVGVVSVTGLLMINGIDAWCIVNGVVAGMVVSAVLVAPYIRKFGSYSLPSYLGRRFDSRLLRLLVAATLSVPLMLLLAAEFKIGIALGARLGEVVPGLIAVVLAAAIAATVMAGGLRSTNWAVNAAAIACVIALVVPVAIVGTELTNFPLAQLSYGPTLRGLGRLEDLRGIPVPLLSPLSYDFAGSGLAPLTRRMAQPFGSLGVASYLLTLLVLMAGVAVAPWVIPRAGATPGIYEARKSLGWAVFVFGAIMLTASAYAVFSRDIVMEQLVGHADSALPDWFQAMVAANDAAVDGRQPQLPMSGFSFRRDALLFMLPKAAHLPDAVSYLLLAGALAAAFCGAATSAQTLATILAEDVVNGGQWEAPSDRPRLLAARIAAAAVIVAGMALALYTHGDPWQLAIWAFGLCAASAFPAVVLSIWWKRMNALGAAASVIVGFSVSVLTIVAGEASWFGVPSEVVSIFAVAAGFLAAAVGTRVGSAPARSILELVRDMRIPGGETVHDREQRLLRLKRLQRPT